MFSTKFKIGLYLFTIFILVPGVVSLLVTLSFLVPPLFFISLPLLLVLLYFSYVFLFELRGAPFSWLGLNFPDIPAVPIRVLWEYPATLAGVNRRDIQRELSFSGFATQFELDGNLSSAYNYMGLGLSPGDTSPNRITSLRLESPEQFRMGWTTYSSDNRVGEEFLDSWVETLTDPAAATKSFWPIIARFGVSYNLLILEKLNTSERRDEIREIWGTDWPQDQDQEVGSDWDDLGQDRFMIDTTIFEKFRPQQVPGGTTPGATRFTPATRILLKRIDGEIVPYAIQVSGFEGADKTTYEVGDGAWLYSIQAAKASITTWGIWIGHVYHWHMGTAAMQMTMFQTMNQQHPIRQVLGRQSDHLIGFNQFLLLHWEVGPPTSFTAPEQFLELMQEFASTREFSDDDPLNRLAALNLTAADFTAPDETDPDAPDDSTDIDTQPWGEYKTVQYILKVWDATERYVSSVVEIVYLTDEEITQDSDLQKWISESLNPAAGNIKGLRDVNTRSDLVSVLTSLIHRITVHGLGRLNQTSNPALSFAGNFPPCLQRATIPSRETQFVFDDPEEPDKSISTFLPQTGTIGDYIKFLYFFTYSTPYNSFIPIEGIEEQPEHPFTGDKEIPLGEALISYRRDIKEIMQVYADDAGIPGPPAQLHQWELNIEN